MSRAPAAPGLVDVMRFAMPPARVLLEAIGAIVTAELKASTSSDQASEPDHVSRRDPIFPSSSVMARVHAWGHLTLADCTGRDDLPKVEGGVPAS